MKNSGFLSKKMPVIFETAIRLALPMPGIVCGALCPETRQGLGHQSVQRQSSDFAFELRDEHQAEANIAAPVVGGCCCCDSPTDSSRQCCSSSRHEARGSNPRLMHLFLTGHKCTVHIFSEFSCIGVFCKGNQRHSVVCELLL
jgi:hypothetical protein